MGMTPSKTCYTNKNEKAVPPNPDPSRWRMWKAVSYKNAIVLMVRYEDCTNFEGLKIMVYRRGLHNTEHNGIPHVPAYLDPHFRETIDSPIARFIPTDEGWAMATKFAKELT